MKYLYVFFSLFCFQPFLPAQGADFAPTGAKWYYNELDFALNRIPHIITSVAKEEYQGKWCSKLEPSSVGSIDWPAAYVYTQNDTVFYYSSMSQRFEMLYNFRAEAGDSWVIGGLAATIPGASLPYDSDTVWVDSVGRTVVGADTLKTWYIHNSYWFDWGKRIFEKAGNDQLFLPRFGLYDVDIWGIRCFESPAGAYHFVNYDCEAVLPYSAAHAPEINPLQIAPNPVFQETRISLPEPAQGRWTLYDSQGKSVRSGSWEGNEVVLNLENERPGIYLFQLRLREGRVWSGMLEKTD